MKYRTVLCEDNDYVREVINFILDERGHEIFAFSNAADCPIHFQHECICTDTNTCADIIISDVSMPKIDGLEFVKRLRAKGCQIKNIALASGYWTEADVDKAIGLGCTVFHKPVRPKELDEWLNKCEKNIHPDRMLSKDFFKQKPAGA